MVEIYAVRINNQIETIKYNKFLQFISKSKQERIRRFIKWQDAQRTLIADILIRYIICNKLRIKNDKIHFNTNKYGKPFLRNMENFQFNISHSGEWVVCAVDNKPIGIDIELIKPINFEIAKQFFSKEEYENLINKKENERLSFFYDLWTLKESYIKAIGKGLSISLDSFTIEVYNDDIKIKGNLKNYFFRQYNIDKNYKLSVCAANKLFPHEVIIKDIKEIGEMILKSCKKVIYEY